MRQFKLLVVGLCAMLLLGLITVAADCGSGQFRAAERPPRVVKTLKKKSTAEQRIENELANTTEIEFIETPLIDAMDFIADLHNIIIVLDEFALQEEGIDTGEPINRVLAGIKLHSVLRLVLEPLGLDYVIEDEVLKITTGIRAEEKLKTHVYDVRKLQQAGFDPDALAEMIRKTIRPASWAVKEPPARCACKCRSKSGYIGGIGGIGGGGGFFSITPEKCICRCGSTSPDTAEAQVKTAKRDDQRADDAKKDSDGPAPAGCCATAQVQACSCDDPGGPGSVVALPGCLVIAQSQHIHKEIVELLEQLARFVDEN